MISGISGVNWMVNNTNIKNQAVSKKTAETSAEFTTDTNKVHELQANSIVSIACVQTGQSIGIYYDDTSTESNPVMLARIIEADGSVNELKIAVNEVEPNNASYVEMVALSAHLAKEGKTDGQTSIFATMVFEGALEDTDTEDIYAKYDFISGMKVFLNNQLKYGQMASYLRNLKEFSLYCNWNKRNI
jgi:hypothetical protein